MRPERAHVTPTAKKIQPIAFRDCRDAISRPTVEKPATVTRETGTNTAISATVRPPTIWRGRLSRPTTIETVHTVHASRRAVRAVMPQTPVRGSGSSRRSWCPHRGRTGPRHFRRGRLELSLELGRERHVAQDDAGLRREVVEELVLGRRDRIRRRLRHGDHAEELVSIADLERPIGVVEPGWVGALEHRRSQPATVPVRPGGHGL